jgi:predicted RNase H-like HicB family nuclease
MLSVRVHYHYEDGVWWADSPDVEGFYAGGDTYGETRAHVEQALPWALEREDVHIEHVVFSAA